MQQRTGDGDPMMQITLPTANETVGLQFSVYGTCSEITPNNQPKMTVKVNAGNGTTSVAAVTNQAFGTFEASFSLPAGTYTQSGSVAVVCSGMSNNATVSPLTIGSPAGGSPPTLTITAPQPDGPDQVTSYPSWSFAVHARGRITGGNGGHVYLRLTDAGHDLFSPASVPVTSDDCPWEFDLAKLFLDAGNPATAHSKHYNVHVSLWHNGEKVRKSSGFFRVGAG